MPTDETTSTTSAGPTRTSGPPARPGVQPPSHFRQELIDRFPILDPSKGAYRWLVLASVMVGTFMAVLDATIVNVALAKLMATFGVSVDHIEWILTAYLLIFGVMLPTSGWMADQWGYKRMYLLGLFLFTLGSFLCSLAGNIDVLIAFRVIQGAGAGFLMPVGMAIITREFPPEKRGIALGFWSVAASASVSLGPTLGGYLIDRFEWNVIFDVNVPVGIMGIFAAGIILREYRPAPQRSFDMLGFVSLSAGLTALLLGLANGNSAWNTGGWTSNFILGSFAIAFFGLAIFLVTEFNVRHPLIEIGLFENFNFSMSNLVLFIFGVGMFGANFLVPIYLQNSLGYTPLQAGLVFLPVGILVGVTAPFAGMFADRHDARVPIVLGMGLLAVTMFQFSHLSLLSEKSQILFPLYLRGIAMGLLMSPLTTIAISEIPNRKMAQASGLINVIRQIGGSFGVALFGTILTRRTIYHAATYGEQMSAYSDAFQRAVHGLQHFALNAVGGTLADAATRARALIVMHAEQQAFVSGMDDVFLVAFWILVLALPPVLFLRRHNVRHGGGGPALTD
ncbi:MAG: DHA2 family efflux MFS transporter permease subunit [Gemmatimonadetes bacterium]|nr:DHA2 family efflux MFS transporter permease subunit [Gemmatimonadota bacterium]